MTLSYLPKQSTGLKQASTERILLEDGQSTTVHTAVYPIDSVTPRIELFTEPTRLVDWCRDNNATEAIVGGFFLRDRGVPLGEVRQAGMQIESEPFTKPWAAHRATLHIAADGLLQIASRRKLPKEPDGDLLQAGPMLVEDGEPIITDEVVDPEGFSSASHQFDTDITVGRYPRAAIGLSDTHIWCVAVDGRSNEDAGLTLSETAAYMAGLGVKSAMNLDGGRSATLISNGRLVNRPRSDTAESLSGYDIYSAITF
jgi:exopolysaccharide biosynthesis protein